MVAYKAAQVPRLLAKPEPGLRAFLLYGPDAGLVADRAGLLAKTLAARSEPPAESVRLDERDLAEDPERLAVEAQTLSMFADAKVLRVKTGPRLRPEALEALIAGGPAALLVVEAGNLRPSAKLRKIFEAAATAAACPCYADSARDIDQSIDREAARLGVSIAPDAKAALRALIGANPALARSELEKLALFCAQTGEITTPDIAAVVAESGEIALDALAQAVADKERESVLRGLDRLTAAGQSPQAGLMALTRYFDRLHRLAVAIEAGAQPARAVASLRPPPSFAQRDALTRQAKRWNRRSAQRAMLALQEAVAMTRRRPQLERQITERLVLRLCQ